MANIPGKAQLTAEMKPMMDELTIDQALTRIRKQLHLSNEKENEILSEIRTHLEDVVAQSREEGGDPQTALKIALERFGIEETAPQLQEVHEGWESIEALAATALPLLFALILRWLAFAPEGTARAWPQLLVQPAFWLVAGAALVIPVLLFRRWRFALVSWGIFWLITVIFVVFPTINRW
jgi:hypothetical protein